MSLRPCRLMAVMGVSLLVHAQGAGAAEPVRRAGFLAVPPLPAPVVDGRVTDAAEWQTAAQVTGWVDSVLGVANRDASVVSLGHAEGVLYLRFACPIPEKFRLNRTVYAGFPLRQTAREKDGDILQDDYVGVYLVPPGGTDRFFLGVNGAGTRRDSRNDELQWDGEWHAQQSQDDLTWLVELAIPLAQFGGATDAEAAWGLNLAHGARQVELLEGLWAYQPAELHPLAEMRLSGQAVATALNGLGELAEGTLALTGWVANSSPGPFAGAFEVAVHDLAGAGTVVFGPQTTPLAVKPGERQDLAAQFAAAGPLCGRVGATVKDAQGALLLDYALPFVFAREVSLETRFIPTPAILQVVLDLGSPASLGKVTGGRVRIASLDRQAEVLTQPLPALRSPLSILDVGCAGLAPGRYEAAVELEQGPARTTLRDTFEVQPRPEWLGNMIGISDRVPEPWTPLVLDQGPGTPTVSCWGRRYSFGPAGFPSQITVLGRELLAGPARVLVTSAGRSEALPAGQYQVTRAGEARVTLRSTTTAAGMTIDAETWIEFDGFVWTRLAVQTPAPVLVDGLCLEIPLKREVAKLWWHPALCHGRLTDRMGAPPQAPLAGEPLNFLRLGDEERGLQLCYESLRQWRPAPGRGQELVPGEAEYVLRYNLIGQPTTLDQPLEFALGYVALPCRPRSALFRVVNANNQWGGGRTWPDKARMDRNHWLFQTYTYGNGWFGRTDCNYFNLWNEEVYDRDCLETFKATGILAPWAENRATGCLYYQACVNDANTPEYRRYRFEWKAVPGNAPYVPPDPKTRTKPVMASVCQQSRSYVDFQVWHMDRLVRQLSDNGRLPLHGYQDCGGHPLCMNALHGCPAEGHFPVLANREWAKRVYVMYKAINPLNQLYIHTGGESAMSWCAFFDVMIEGEQYTAPYLADRVNDPSLPQDYTRLLDLARFRAQCQPCAWGPERFFLTQFHGWLEQEPDEARGAMGHLWGLSLCHDVPVWGTYPPASVSRAIAELGWDDQVEFIPYWRTETGIEVKAPAGPVVASGWRRGQGHLLLLVLNDSEQEVQAEVRIDLGRYGFATTEVHCRDYGAAGLAYPEALFTYRVAARQDVDLQLLPVQDALVQPGTAMPVGLGRRSFRLLRFWQ